jgi:hypothetical protein
MIFYDNNVCVCLLKKVNMSSVVTYLTSDPKCMKYFQNLEMGSFDSAAMIRRQEKLLIELAEIDAKLLAVEITAYYTYIYSSNNNNYNTCLCS